MLRNLRLRAYLVGLIALLAVSPLPADPVSPPAAAKPAASPKPQIPGKTTAAKPGAVAGAIRQEDLLRHVNLTIRWYREVQTGGQLLSQPSDVFFWTTQRTLATEALQSVFATARAELPLVPPPLPAPAAPKTAAATDPTAAQQRLARMAADRIDRIEDLQTKIYAVNQEIQGTSDAATRATLTSKRDALQSEVVFLIRLRDTLQKMGGLLNAPGDISGTATLSGQIDSLQQSVADEVGAATPPASTDMVVTKGLESGGLIARTQALFRLLKCQRGLDGLLADTAELQTQLDATQAPLRAAIRTVVQDGDHIGDTLETAPAGDLAGLEHRVETLTDQFQDLSAALLPLRQEASVFEKSQHNLEQWREAVHKRETGVARVLAERSGTIIVMLGLVLAVSEVWRRMTMRYVTDPRRRRQFLFIRRMVTGGLMILVLLTAFVSDFGSLATFAGFLTAGIAVALQTIIASMAAYFFLLGRYGLKVGDRITAGGVTGDVEDVGLVRFYLKELSASGGEMHPTGRVVVFPNSVIFQSTPLFKQLPGTEFTWHEAAVTLTSGGNASHAREKVLAAVLAAYAEYRPLLEEPRAKAEKVSGLKTDLPKPYAQLRAHDDLLELCIGYPVNFQQVSEIDQLVLKHVTAAIAEDPLLQQSVTGHPRTGVATKN